MKLKSVTKEETAYDKWITFEHEGQEYSAILHWDKWDGFDLTFTELGVQRAWIETPEWAVMWEDNNNESLELKLDELTDETLEESYL